MFNKFLVPINPDDRDIASGIVAHATWLAGRLASEVVCSFRHSIRSYQRGAPRPRRFSSGPSVTSSGVSKAWSSPRRARESRLETVVEFGSPAETIVETCRRLACDIIAMSTHGGGLFGQGTCRQRDDGRDCQRACSGTGNQPYHSGRLALGRDRHFNHTRCAGRYTGGRGRASSRRVPGCQAGVQRRVDAGPWMRSPRIHQPRQGPTRVLPDENGVLYRRERQGPESNGTASRRERFCGVFRGVPCTAHGRAKEEGSQRQVGAARG